MPLLSNRGNNMKMLFCFNSHPREEEYQFLTEELDDDDEPELINTDHESEAHDNCINQELAALKLSLDIKVIAADNNNHSLNNMNNNNNMNMNNNNMNNHMTNMGSHVTGKEGALHILQHSPATARTFLKNSNNSHSNSKHSDTPDTPTATPTGNKTKLSKPLSAASSLCRNLSQALARSNHANKGTEHLQKEAARKSAEAANNSNSNQIDTRYIRLPSNNGFRPSAAANHSPTAQAPFSTPSHKHQQRHSTPQQQHHHPLSASKSDDLVSGRKSALSTSSSSSPCSPLSNNSIHKSPSSSSSSSTTSGRPDSPPSLVPRSANNPPPRPKQGKPVRSSSSVSDDMRLYHSSMKRRQFTKESLQSQLPKAFLSASASPVSSNHHHCDANSGQHEQESQNQGSGGAGAGGQGGHQGASNGQQGGGGSAANGGSQSSNSHQQFINKPPRGWLHPDHLLTESAGASYPVKYIGFIGVNTSMKTLDFDTRSLIAKESINRVCEAAGLKTADKNRKPNKRIDRMLADMPNLENAGEDVTLSITSAYLNMTSVETGKSLAKHEMPNISFASGGDTDTLDFAAYVAKDATHGRACFVLECGGGRAQDVITTIGQAFELRFKEFLKRSTERFETYNGNPVPSVVPPRSDDREYYNDLPGKMPPEMSEKPTAAPRKSKPETSLIDLTEDSAVNSSNVTLPPRDPQYVNCSTPPNEPAESKPASKDPFDMQPFTNALVENEAASGQRTPPVGASSAAEQQPSTSTTTTSESDEIEYVPNDKLVQESWFHGPISRKEAESFVQKDGDFLVRESQNTTGQYVLTGMQNAARKHLLLVDPEGIVRTKDKTFSSVSHLINYHRKKSLPIISSESALILKNPILVMPKS